MRVAVVEPVAMFREILEWHIGQLTYDEQHSIEFVSSPSDAHVVLTWTAESVNSDSSSRVIGVSVYGQKQIASAVELLQLLIAIPSKRLWEQPSITPAKPSRRELVVLTAIATGLTAAEIATQLGMSRHTVYGHRRRLYRRWGVHSSLEAVAYGSIEVTSSVWATAPVMKRPIAPQKQAMPTIRIRDV